MLPTGKRSGILGNENHIECFMLNPIYIYVYEYMCAQGARVLS